MSLLAEVLRLEDVHLDVSASNKDELLEKLAQLLAGRHGLVEQHVLESLRAREQLGSTALGQGVAIPHARMYECFMATGVFVRTQTPLPFDAPDGKPVSLMLGLVVPRQATQRHLRLLADAATVLSDEHVRSALMSAGDANAVLDLLLARAPQAEAKREA